MTDASRFRTKRAYEPAAATDGIRVLVDRLWPRGVRKQDAHIDLWLKDIAPSSSLRQWFGHDPKRWNEFKRRYYHELGSRREPVERLLALSDADTVTLVYAAHDREHNQARALADYFG